MKRNKITILILAWILSACGKEQDPTKNSKYESLRQAEPLAQRLEPENEAMLPLYNIDCLADVSQVSMQSTNNCDLNFVQGAEKKVYFRVRFRFADANVVRYQLQLQEGELKSQGATLSRYKGDLWVMSWRPVDNLLSAAENFRRYELEILFHLDNKNSPKILNQFAGADQVNKWQTPVHLFKRMTQPMIRGDFQVTPSKALSSNQKAQIKFTLALANTTNAENIDIYFVPGPTEPSSELVQIDARAGYSGRPQLQSQSQSSGQQMFNYTFLFDAKLFLDRVTRQVCSDGRLRQKLETGELKTAEALVSVEAINRYTGEKSQVKQDILKVDMSGLKCVSASAPSAAPKKSGAKS